MSDPLDAAAMTERALELAAKAKPAPWLRQCEPDDSGWYLWACPNNHQVVAGEIDLEDAEFIGFAREALPVLARAFLALQGQLDEADDLIDWYLGRAGLNDKKQRKAIDAHNLRRS